MKTLRAVGGKGGDGCISFLQLWANENAGPDGGHGGNGGHVILKVIEKLTIIELSEPSLANVKPGAKMVVRTSSRKWSPPNTFSRTKGLRNSDEFI